MRDFWKWKVCKTKNRHRKYKNVLLIICDERGSKFLWNDGVFTPEYGESHTRKLQPYGPYDNQYVLTCKLHIYTSGFCSVFCCPVKHSVCCHPEFLLPSFFVWNLETFVVFRIRREYSRLNTDISLVANQSRYAFKCMGEAGGFYDVLKLLVITLTFLNGSTGYKTFNQITSRNVSNSPSKRVNVSTYDTPIFLILLYLACTCRLELTYCGCVIIGMEEIIIVASLENMNKYVCSNYVGLLEELFSRYSKYSMHFT
jgi:hypothetical protein